MKKNKKIIFILLVILIIFISLIILFINNLRKDQIKTKKVMNEILSKYDEFEDQVLVFNDIRDKVYSSVFVDTYYDTIKEKYKNNINSLKELEDSVNVIINKSKKLKNNCKGYFSSSDVNSKCLSFNNTYEEVINSFVTDINKYNEIIDNYNEYITENGTGEILDKYKSSKKYIDFNNDSKYSGKE